MGLMKKMMGMGTAKSEETKQRIAEIFNSAVADGESYITLGAFHMETKKKLLKEIHTYYNYIIGYRDGDDPEIVIIPTTSDLESVETPVVLKKSQCQSAEYRAKIGQFYIKHPDLAGGEIVFSIIASTAWAGFIIDVSYVDEFMPWTEFFQKFSA